MKIKEKILLPVLVLFLLQFNAVKGQVTPKKTDSFIRSMGVNIKLDRDRYKSNDGYNEKVLPALRDLGIRHTRSSHFAHSTYGPQNRKIWTELGIKSLYVTGSYEGGQTPNDVRNNSKAAADYLYAVEGQNEPDIFLAEGFGWPYQKYTDRSGTYHVNTSSNYKASRAWHKDMLYYLINDAATKNLRVATTPMAFANNVPKIVPIAHDLESFHHYTHRSIITDNLTNSINQTHGYGQGGTPKPILLTEFGWKTGGSNSVTEKTQAKNILTGFCEYFNRGVKLSYIHELIHNDWGLIKTNGTRKPAFKALRKMIELLEEANFDKNAKKWSFPEYTTKSLNLEVLNANSSTHKVLLQKSNGTYFLLLWRNIDRSRDDGTDLTNGTDEVTVKVNGNLQVATQYKYDSSFNLVKSPMTINNKSIKVKVPDNVIIIRLEVPVSNVYRKIENKSNTKVIKANPNDQNGANVLQDVWDGGSRKQWELIYSGGLYRIQNKSNNKVLQANVNNENGASIKQSSWADLDSQKWKLNYLGDGYYEIVNKKNGKCIRSKADGSNNDPKAQESWKNWSSQKWKLISVPSSAKQRMEYEIEAMASMKVEQELETKPMIYPNPTNGIFTVQGFNFGKVKVYDISGKLKLESSLEGNNLVDISQLPIGVYII